MKTGSETRHGRGTSKLTMLSAMAAALVMQLACATVAPARLGTWSAQTSGTTNWLEGVSCPTATNCWAVGANGTIVATTNTGSSWSTQTAGTTNGLVGVSCPTATNCWAVGYNGAIVATTNAGSSWSTQASGTTYDLYGVWCPTATRCWAVGGNGTIVATTNAGLSWSTQTSGTTNGLVGVSCPTATNCWAVGYNGAIVTTTNAGLSWSTQTPGTAYDLYGVWCATATNCWAVGANGAIVTTTNAGLSWSTQTSGTAYDLLGVWCPTATNCWAVGHNGTIVAMLSAGTVPPDPMASSDTVCTFTGNLRASGSPAAYVGGSGSFILTSQIASCVGQHKGLAAVNSAMSIDATGSYKNLVCGTNSTSGATEGTADLTDWTTGDLGHVNFSIPFVGGQGVISGTFTGAGQFEGESGDVAGYATIFPSTGPTGLFTGGASNHPQNPTSVDFSTTPGHVATGQIFSGGDGAGGTSSTCADRFGVVGTFTIAG